MKKMPFVEHEVRITSCGIIRGKEQKTGERILTISRAGCFLGNLTSGTACAARASDAVGKCRIADFVWLPVWRPFVLCRC